MTSKTHYRKAFASPYLASADIDAPVNLTILFVMLEADQTGESDKWFNTAYFEEPEIRPGEKLKPMILNDTNCKAMLGFTGSKFIDDWSNTPVSIVVKKVEFNGEMVDGLRVDAPIEIIKQDLTPAIKHSWQRAIELIRETGSLDAVRKNFNVSPKHIQALTKAAK